MILIKNTADTLGQVIANMRSASNTLPGKVQHGDIVLVAQTKNTLKKGEKSIRYVMYFDESYEDVSNESEALWGKKWKYIIKCFGIRSVEAFDIEDIQVSKHNYKAVVTHCSLLKEDEEAVLDWIFFDKFEPSNRNDIYGVEFDYPANNDQLLLDKLDKKYSSAPDFKKRMTGYFNRPSALRDALIRIKGTQCQICGIDGFYKKNSNEKYCEIHHMIELNQNAPKSLQSWNVVVVCATCHRRLHYGNVSSVLNANGQWEISLDGHDPVVLL